MLGLTKKATQAEIKKNFYELAKKHHPDTGKQSRNDEEKFKQITAAYDLLSNEKTRKAYDDARAGPTQGPGGFSTAEGGMYGHQEQTFTYKARGAGYDGFGGNRKQTQQSYEEWKKTQKDDGQYNFFYEDLRGEANFHSQYNRRRGGSTRDRTHYTYSYRKENHEYSKDDARHRSKRSKPTAPFTMLFAYGLCGFFGLQFIVMLFTGGGSKSKPNNYTAVNNSNYGASKVLNQNQLYQLPQVIDSPQGYRDVGYQSLASHSHTNQLIQMNKKRAMSQHNAQGLQCPHIRNLKEEKEIKIHTKKSEGTGNLLDPEICRLRREGKKPPKELLKAKFAFNRERHQRQYKTQQEGWQAEYDMQEAFLKDIEEINRQQVANGLKPISTQVKYQKVEEGKVLKPAGKSAKSEPFYQDRRVKVHQLFDKKNGTQLVEEKLPGSTVADANRDALIDLEATRNLAVSRSFSIGRAK